jgi:hypothetical protein
MSHRATRVWIEIERPTGKEFKDPVLRNAEAARRAELATNMLARLNAPEPLDGYKFWWSEHEGRYCYGGPMGYQSLADDGEWFNLEHLGRPL